jgi:hypothetical protein
MAILIVPQQSLKSTSEQSASDVQSLFRALAKIELHVAVKSFAGGLAVARPSPGDIEVSTAPSVAELAPSVPLSLPPSVAVS